MRALQLIMMHHAIGAVTRSRVHQSPPFGLVWSPNLPSHRKVVWRFIGYPNCCKGFLPERDVFSLTRLATVQSTRKRSCGADLVQDFAVNCVGSRNSERKRSSLVRPSIPHYTRFSFVFYPLVCPFNHGYEVAPAVGQFDGLVKLGSICCHAASFVTPAVLYASSGVRPARVECGRRVL